MYSRYAEVTRLEGGSDLCQRFERGGRAQGSHRPDQRQQRLQPAEIRERRASRAAGAGHRSSRAACTPRRSRWRCCRKPTRWRCKIDAKDIRIDTFCSSGPGGQSREHDLFGGAHHAPARPAWWCPARTKNRRSRTAPRRCACCARASMRWSSKSSRKRSAPERRSMVGSGDRSEKIRTYNFPQNRVTDHRIGLTLHRLDSVMDGELTEFVDTLTTHFQTESLKGEKTNVN